jgi:DNA invertase Pin-like site-specific DNA recombinase
MLYGYARVSTDGQSTRAQLAALRAAGVRHVVEETRSGALSRPALEALIARLRPGDVVIVWKVDRLARSLRGLLDAADGLTRRGAFLRSLTEPIDTGTPVGRAFFQLLGVFAELERSLIRERCAAGRAEYLARGGRLGRERTFSYAKAARLRDKGLTYEAIARRVGSHPATVRNALVRNGLAPPVR